MPSIKKPITPTPFINVLTTAIPNIDPETGSITYITTFQPESIEVRQRDTIINYQLVSPTPDGVTFENMTVQPEDTQQLSTPSIGWSGKVITFSDANTKTDAFNITLFFTDTDGVKFSVDPEVINNPD